jgi:threonylcarbamoyladenosine tRNA methylthiotransferase MtaB
VQVQNGCDHRCTFCIIPFGRGNSRSVPLGAITDQVRLLVENGTREVVLSGVDITSYGGDLPGRPTLGQAIKRLLAAVPGLERLRLSSLDVAEVDETLLGLIGDEPRLMPHLHLSLQAGDDMILKRMKRRHNRAQAVAFCEEARRRRPGIVFGADLIAGFPTETEAQFANTLSLVGDCDLVYPHVFPYSPRDGTPAARMPQVDGAARKDRAARLRAAGADVLRRHLASRVGCSESVLMETSDDGRTETFASARMTEARAPGSIVAARITGVDGETLIAEAA